MRSLIASSFGQKPFLLNLVVATIAIIDINAAGEPLAQPLAWKTLRPGYSEYCTLSTTGRIWEINGRTYNIAVTSDKPFWAPKPHVFGRVALWPANTLLIVHVSAAMPLTIDGKKARCDQLAVGQAVNVQYCIYITGGCAAIRIDARNR